MAGAFFLITFGLILLSNNFGVISWTIWRNLIPFWPVLLIFAGVDTIFGKTRTGKFLAGVINSLIFLTIIARVIGLDLPLIKNIPLPKEKSPVPQFYFTEKPGERNVF